MKSSPGVPDGNWTALDAYLREVNASTPLSDAETAALGSCAEGPEPSVRTRLIEAHLSFVVRIARQYVGFGLPLADLIAEGNLALMRAAELYRAKFGTKFTTYASVWIKQRMQRALTSQARSVRLPVWRSQRLRKVTRLMADFGTQLGRPPTDEEFSEHLGLSPEQMAALQGDRLQVVSLDAPARPGEEGDAAWHEAFPDENAVHPADQLAEREQADEVLASLHELDDRELKILTLKHGFHPEGEVSFRQLGRRLGVSHEWVRRIAELALVKVRRTVEARRALPHGERQRRKASVLQRLRHLHASPAPSAVPGKGPRKLQPKVNDSTNTDVIH